MNEILENYVIKHLTEKGGRSTKNELFSSVKERFKESELKDNEIESELIKSTRILGTIENGENFYTLL